ncbi:MT-A70 family methyltransferase [Rhizobium sp. Leaf384]|uniref:MT-A70 family methyltransferase n=1 Tax=Rhizobium sp. Leaf384 TaxID=1736358 RepID=UPI000A8D1E2F|nr:MT-A70 family methyltransferase [Rhizobium sp. Leaf384]
MAKLAWESEFSIKTGNGDMASAVRVDEIVIGHRLRSVDQVKVDALKVSIADLGLRTPISLFLGGEDGRQMFLAAGAHRLEAVRQLGREWIAAVVREEDAFDAELWEIDENLCRAELTPADRALFVFRRKELYLMKHPETDLGSNQHSPRVRQVGEGSDAPKRFTAATAEATGQSERAIQRDSERGEKISEQALRMLRGTRHDKGVVLDRLKSLRAEEQTVYVRALFEVDKAKEAEAKEIRTEKMSTKRAVRTGIINAIAAHGKVTAGEMPRAAFPIGYCDFPWEQEAWSETTGQDRGLMYPAMSIEDGRALCAGDRSPFTPDALLFFWVTTNRFSDGLSIIEAWGFRYVTAITWDKMNIGMGRWVRDRTEHLLICKRGDFPGLEMGTQPESLYSEAKTEHSRKPMWFAKEIDRLFPDMRKLELFQRKESLHFADVRNGPTWAFWGFEAGEPEAVQEDGPAQVETPVAVPDEPPDQVREAILAAGLAGNGFLLDLNRGLSGPANVQLPSRLFRFPVEYMDRKRFGGDVSRILLRHPLLWEREDVAPLLHEIEAKTGVRPEWQDLDEFGRDFGAQWRWFHAVDLCTDSHWKDLLETLQFTEREEVFGAVKFALECKSLSVKNARSIMAHLSNSEPDDRSVSLLHGKDLMPYDDGKKLISPNISTRGEAGAWLVIHGLEDKFFKYAGKFLSVSAAGMAAREMAKGKVAA